MPRNSYLECISWEEFEKTLKKRKLAVYKAEDSDFLKVMRDRLEEGASQGNSILRSSSGRGPKSIRRIPPTEQGSLDVSDVFPFTVIVADHGYIYIGSAFPLG
jgi:hypothetical protein